MKSTEKERQYQREYRAQNVEKLRAYRKRPEVMARRREALRRFWKTPHGRAKHNADSRKLYQRPDIKAKRLSRAKVWHMNNPEKALEMVRHSSRRRRDARTALLAQAKARPCMDCGGTFHAIAMDFDHVRGEKSFNIGRKAGSVTLDALMEEIAKCDVVCSNCHRVRTWITQKREPRRKSKHAPAPLKLEVSA